MKLYTYRLTVDDGSAPNPYGVCSLAICKPKIRKYIKEGDWIAGFVGTTLNRLDANNLLYAMKISETMTFQEYNKKYKNKIPSKNNKTGDCIYFKEKDDDEEYKQRLNYAHNKDNMKTDLGGEKVIIGTEFYYFGEKSIKLDYDLLDIIPPQQGHRSNKNKKYIEPFINFIKQQKQGINGKPYMKMPKNICKTISKCSKKEKNICKTISKC